MEMEYSFFQQNFVLILFSVLCLILDLVMWNINNRTLNLMVNINV